MTELMERRRALMAAKRGGDRLPAGYQEVEWIESSGTQAIITPCWLKQNTEAYCEFLFTGSGAQGFPATFGCANPNLLFARRIDTASWVYCSFGNQSDKVIDLQGVSFYGDSFHSVSMNANRTVIDEEYSVGYNATVAENESRKIAVFARMSASNTLERFSYRRIRVLRITEGDTTTLDLVPCYRKADGEIGMFDLVSKTFLTNAGTGTFTKGADVN